MMFESIKHTINFLFEEENKNAKYIHSMQQVIAKLSEKEKNLKTQLESEANENNRKNILLKLKVVTLQQQKGERLIQNKLSA